MASNKELFSAAQCVARSKGEMPLLRCSVVFKDRKHPGREKRNKEVRDMIREYI